MTFSNNPRYWPSDKIAMKLGSYWKGKRIHPKYSNKCRCCDSCKKHLHIRDEKEKKHSSQSYEKAPPRPNAFSIFIFPTDQSIPEKPSSVFSIYTFPAKQFTKPKSTPFSIYQEIIPKKQKKPSKYSFYPSPPPKISFNLYRNPRSVQVANIYETWTHSVNDRAIHLRNWQP